ncbi:hypothetical protein [Antrihabitans cavernicola]|uniref:DUF8020 domain-containing protein n=1 Tax=Antrihabitans cavernicola TaxID=2495913 RepID=A0A5A7SIR9_9NOCA|nr:hypothetical protein [Spelaeibacter cavernicola]KAA0024617.1 hypothetical protein FOY51_01295 [Spelaeibacter cavernicola]
MKLNKLAATAALVIASIGIASGTANAAPAPAPAAPAGQDLGVDVLPGVHYSATNNGKSAVITAAAGTLTVENGNFEVKDATGKVIAGTPLTAQIGDISVPIDAKVSGNTATITPDASRGVFHPVDLPFQDTAPWKTPYDREQAAWNRLKDTISTGAAVGAIVGAIFAGGVGCLIGGVVAGGGTAVGSFGFLAALGIPAAIIGCIGGAVVFAPLGALGGSILIGAPVAIAAAVQYFTTINAPFKPAK